MEEEPIAPPERAPTDELPPEDWTAEQVIANSSRPLRGGLDDEEGDNAEPEWEDAEPEEESPEQLPPEEEEEEPELDSEDRPPSRFVRDTQDLFARWRAEAYAPAPRRPDPPQRRLWCTRPEPDFPGVQIPRRKRAELVLAAALAAEALPARDVRPRPLQASAPTEQANAPAADTAVSASEPEEDAPDFSVEGIRRHIQQRWDQRPNGIRYARWQEMMENFAQRMAARIATERQMATRDSAADGADGADPEELEEQESTLEEQEDQEEHQQSELEAAGAVEPQKSPSGAVGP